MAADFQLTVGDLARATGTKVVTIRYDERIKGSQRRCCADPLRDPGIVDSPEIDAQRGSTACAIDRDGGSGMTSGETVLEMAQRHVRDGGVRVDGVTLPARSVAGRRTIRA